MARKKPLQVPGEAVEAVPVEAAPEPVIEALPDGRPNYAQMRADDVDPKTLSRSVLTLDGWVCPG